MARSIESSRAGLRQSKQLSGQSTSIDEDSEAYYQLACALTRLGRIKEALSALTKSVELDEEQVDYMVEEPDLKALSALPGFKKLIPEPAKQ